MKWKILLVIIIAAHVLILAKMVFFPYPELFLYPYLVNHGFLPYKQIFDQHFPSILMLPINISTFGLSSPATARMFSIGLAIFTQIFLFGISRSIFKSEKKAILVNLFYFFIQPVFEGYVLWIDTFIVPVTLAAFYLLWRFFEEKKLTFAFWAGLFAGLSVFIKQSMLPLAVVVGILLLVRSKSFKAATIYGAGVLVPLAVLLSWIIKNGIFADFYYWTVKFNLEVYPKMAGKFPTLKQLARGIVFFAPAALLFLTKARRKLVNIIAGLFLVFSLGAAGNRFELVHLQPALPFVAYLTVSFVEALGKRLRLIFLLAIFVPSAFLVSYLLRGLISTYVYFFDETTVATANEVNELTKPGDRIFIMGSQPIIHPLADRMPAGGVFSVSLPWNMKVVEDTILVGIEKDRPAAVVRDSSAIIDGIVVLDYMRKIDKFVNANYKLAKKIGPNEILIPKRQ